MWENGANKRKGGFSVEEKKKNTEWKKKAAVGVVAAAASASVLVGGAFDSPADLLSPDGDENDNSPTPVVHTLSAQTADLVDDGGSDSSDNEEEDRRQRFPAVRRWILGLPIGVRALIGVPLWAIGWAITAGLSLLWQAALAPIGGKILSWVLAAVAAVLVFALTAKALFPNVPWKKILRPRNILLVVIGMAVLGTTDTLLSIFWKDYPPIGQAARLIGGAAMIACACFASRKLLSHKEEKAEAEEEPPAPQLSVEEQAMALADTVCPRPIQRP